MCTSLRTENVNNQKNILKPYELVNDDVRENQKKKN